jgi:hypothetical protein
MVPPPSKRHHCTIGTYQNILTFQLDLFFRCKFAANICRLSSAASFRLLSERDAKLPHPDRVSSR